MKNTLLKYLSISILVITISSIAQWSSLPLNLTVVWWCIYALILFIFWKSKEYLFDTRDQNNIRFVHWYLIWNLICIIRGFFEADNYWEFKNLVGAGMVLLLPLSIYVSTNPVAIQRIVSYWLKYALPAFFLIAISFTYSDAVGRYLVPISFLLLFFPILTNKWKIVILAFALIVFLTDLNARSNVIKFSVPLLLSTIYYIRNFITRRILELIRNILVLLPFILFILGITNTFNIFKMDEYISGDFTTEITEEGKKKEASLLSDTRTGLYYEVLNSAIKYDYVLFGRTPARGNESMLFGNFLKSKLNTGKMERFSNEVSILNVFTWTGILGVFIYFLIFYKASYLAINKSKNIFSKIMGLYVAFRWAYAWVEDFSNFDLSFLFLWLSIGICFSHSFRAMNNTQLKYWIRGIFDIRYRILSKLYRRNITTNMR